MGFRGHSCSLEHHCLLSLWKPRWPPGAVSAPLLSFRPAHVGLVSAPSLDELPLTGGPLELHAMGHREATLGWQSSAEEGHVGVSSAHA